MAIIDLDELKAKKEQIGFKLFKQEYVIPEMSYGLTLQLDEIRKRVMKSAKDEDYKATMEGSIETITKVIPAMDAEKLRTEASVNQLRKIVEIINQAFIGEDELTEDRKEISFYRDKYEDEYRKNEPKTREKKKR